MVCQKPSTDRSITAHDFDPFADPIRRQVNPADASSRFDFFFDHLHPEDAELGFGIFAGIPRLNIVLFGVCFFFQDGHNILNLTEDN